MAHTGVVYARPTVGGETLSFGVSGKLWRDSLVMYDRNTYSLWSQVLGRAIAGPLKGVELKQIPSELSSWESWKKRHPETLAMKKTSKLSRYGSVYTDYHRSSKRIGIGGTPNPDSRLQGKQLVYGLMLPKHTAAVPFSLLEKHPVLNVEVNGVPIAVFSPPDENAAMAFKRIIDGKDMTFERVPNDKGKLTVRDTGTESEWSWERGQCLQGPFEGKQLERIPGLTVYWGIWAQFHPETELISQPK